MLIKLLCFIDLHSTSAMFPKKERTPDCTENRFSFLITLEVVKKPPEASGQENEIHSSYLTCSI